ncbi:MAG TPA: hypothetical protein VNM14_26575 [Planctomycetota bacterium]|jgi:hypothetical protein|nr:hypothetical protein [Planctomycetota bacterium]
MKKIAVLFLALLAGCWYDRPNPWRTERDVERYNDKKEEDWLLELEHPYDLPQNAGVAFTLPDLEGWRDTVLGNADALTLTRMRDQSASKAATLESRAMSMAPIREDNKVQIYELLWQSRVEKIRLRMIEDRLSAVGR